MHMNVLYVRIFYDSYHGYVAIIGFTVLFFAAIKVDPFFFFFEILVS